MTANESIIHLFVSIVASIQSKPTNHIWWKYQKWHAELASTRHNAHTTHVVGDREGMDWEGVGWVVGEVVDWAVVGLLQTEQAQKK